MNWKGVLVRARSALTQHQSPAFLLLELHLYKQLCMRSQNIGFEFEGKDKKGFEPLSASLFSTPTFALSRQGPHRSGASPPASGDHAQVKRGHLL